MNDINQKYILTIVIDKDTKLAKISPRSFIQGSNKEYYQLRDRIYKLYRYTENNKLEDILLECIENIENTDNTTVWNNTNTIVRNIDPKISYLRNQTFEIENQIVKLFGAPTSSKTFEYCDDLGGSYQDNTSFFYDNSRNDSRKMMKEVLADLKTKYTYYEKELLRCESSPSTNDDIVFDFKVHSSYIPVTINDKSKLDICHKINLGCCFINEVEYLKSKVDKIIPLLEYEETAKEIMLENYVIGNIKAHSHKKKGWWAEQFNIDNDFRVEINTNFGYGRSSYFYLIINYKGLKLTPYSKYVHYRNLNYNEFHKYTLEASLENSEWERLFTYVIESYNMAHRSPTDFINKYFIDELDSMVNGLEILFSKYLKEFKPKLGRKILFEVGESVYLIENNAIEKVVKSRLNYNSNAQIEVYDKEIYHEKFIQNNKIIISEESLDYEYFPFEKIVGALDYIEAIKKIEEVAEVQHYIERVLNLNKSVVKLAEGVITYLETIIKIISVKTEEFNKELCTVNDELSRFNALYTPILEEVKKGVYSVEELLDAYFYYKPKKKPSNDNTVWLDENNVIQIRSSIKEMNPLCLPYFAETLTRKMHPEFDIINLRSKKNELHKLKSDYGRIIDSLKEYIDKYSLGITKIKDTFVTDRNNEKQ